MNPFINQMTSADDPRLKSTFYKSEENAKLQLSTNKALDVKKRLNFESPRKEAKNMEKAVNQLGEMLKEVAKMNVNSQSSSSSENHCQNRWKISIIY